MAFKNPTANLPTTASALAVAGMAGTSWTVNSTWGSIFGAPGTAIVGQVGGYTPAPSVIAITSKDPAVNDAQTGMQDAPVLLLRGPAKDGALESGAYIKLRGTGTRGPLDPQIVHVATKHHLVGDVRIVGNVTMQTPGAFDVIMSGGVNALNNARVTVTAGSAFTSGFSDSGGTYQPLWAAQIGADTLTLGGCVKSTNAIAANTNGVQVGSIPAANAPARNQPISAFAQVGTSMVPVRLLLMGAGASAGKLVMWTAGASIPAGGTIWIFGTQVSLT